MTNAATYTELVNAFIEKVSTYLQQFESEIGRETKKGIVRHFDYKLPFKEKPAKVTNLDVIRLKDTLRNYEFSEQNVVAFIEGKHKMFKINFHNL